MEGQPGETGARFYEGKTDMNEQHEVDAWDARRLELKRRYVAEGMSEDEADERATNEVRREIRNAPSSTEREESR